MNRIAMAEYVHHFLEFTDTGFAQKVESAQKVVKLHKKSCLVKKSVFYLQRV